MAQISPAWGDEDSERFERLGRATFSAGEYQDAVAGFEAAYEQGNLPRYLYNLALAYQKMGRTMPIRLTPTSDGLPGRLATDVRALAGTHRLTARIPVIMVTGDSSAPLVRACLRGGAVD